tara:strand:- start:561 stop:1013 length:453 start_codon:yes stop_codon:yes gene_type:complete
MKKLILAIFLLTISCTNNKVINSHGPSSLDLKSNKIKVLIMNRNDILELFGKPSTESLFDENKWFYIERKKVNQSLFKLGKQKIEKNYILEINFNKNGIVVSKNLYTTDNMNELKIVKGKTKKEFDDKSYIQKILNSVRQKIDAPKKNRR